MEYHPSVKRPIVLFLNNERIVDLSATLPFNQKERKRERERGGGGGGEGREKEREREGRGERWRNRKKE